MGELFREKKQGSKSRGVVEVVVLGLANGGG